MSIATNESYRRIALERGRMPPDKVFVVRSGPSLDRLKILPPDPALKKGRKYLVGYVGVMGRQEGIDLLLQAARYIVREKGRQDVHFGLVGGGTELNAMKALAAELGVADYVTFTGRVPDAELLAMLNTADVCVNPDVANEMNDKSTMNKIMEYMALGKPIVQFDLTEGRFSAQEASLYARQNDPVDMAEKILSLLDDEDRRRSMGNFGRLRVANELSWDHEVPKLLAAYDAVFATRKAQQLARRAHRRAPRREPQVARCSRAGNEQPRDRVSGRACRACARGALGPRAGAGAGSRRARPATPGLPACPGTSSREKYTAAADRILAGSFHVFALENAPLGFPPKWNTDPKTGTAAPLTFGKSLDYRNPRNVGDIKYLVGDQPASRARDARAGLASHSRDESI